MSTAHVIRPLETAASGAVPALERASAGSRAAPGWHRSLARRARPAARSPPRPCASSSGIAARPYDVPTATGRRPRRPRPARRSLGLAVNPDLWFGEAYMAGRLDVRGPLEPVVEALSRLTVDAVLARPDRPGRSPSPTRCGRRETTSIITTISATASTSSGSTRSWSTPAPTSNGPSMSLDEAQRAKLDLVCRKLQLRPGDTVVEAGCGWGALALFMARHYGVRVKAFNVSREQLAFARDRAAREGPRRIASSSSTTTTATSAARSTCSSRSACWSTSAWRTSTRSPRCFDRTPAARRRPRACSTSSAAMRPVR